MRERQRQERLPPQPFLSSALEKQHSVRPHSMKNARNKLVIDHRIHWKTILHPDVTKLHPISSVSQKNNGCNDGHGGAQLRAPESLGNKNRVGTKKTRSNGREKSIFSHVAQIEKCIFVLRQEEWASALKEKMKSFIPSDIVG